MKTLQQDEGIALVSLEGLSLRDLEHLDGSAVASALRSVLGVGAADGEVVASFANEGDDRMSF